VLLAGLSPLVLLPLVVESILFDSKGRKSDKGQLFEIVSLYCYWVEVSLLIANAHLNVCLYLLTDRGHL
jgi:hypothetical protein